MRKNAIVANAVSCILFVLHLSSCAQLHRVSDYGYDRSNDLQDIITISGGLGLGAKVRTGPLSLGQGVWVDCTGMRGGDCGLSWGIISVSHHSMDAILGLWSFEVFTMATEENTQRRGKTFLAGDNEKKRFLIVYPDPENGHNQPHYPYYYFSQIEAAAGLGPSVRLGFNPGEAVDFALGLANIDIMKDDIKKRSRDALSEEESIKSAFSVSTPELKIEKEEEREDGPSDATARD